MKVRFDEKQLDLSRVSDVGGISLCSLRSNLPNKKEDECATFAEATHAIVHPEESDLTNIRAARSALACDSIQPCLVLFRVSKGGKNYLLTAAHEKWKHRDNCHRDNCTHVAYLLAVRNQSILERGDDTSDTHIKALYSVTPQEAECIYSEELAELRTELKTLFIRPNDKSFLTALSIMCQGYLAVKNPAAFALRTEINNRISANGVAEAVDNPAWWLAVIESPETATAALMQQWTGATGDRSHVAALLGAIARKNLTVELVRNADDALRENLTPVMAGNARG